MNATEIRNHLYHDIFVTALEGAIGYWSQASQYKWSIDGKGDEEDTTGFIAVINDVEEDDEPEHTIDWDCIDRGWKLACGVEGTKIRWNCSVPNDGYATDEDSYGDFDFDAGDADCVVQLGLFGKVVYG